MPETALYGGSRCIPFSCLPNNRLAWSVAWPSELIGDYVLPRQQARLQNVAPWLAARGRRSRCCLATHGRKVSGSLRQATRNTGAFRQPVKGESDTLASCDNCGTRERAGHNEQHLVQKLIRRG